MGYVGAHNHYFRTLPQEKQCFCRRHLGAALRASRKQCAPSAIPVLQNHFSAIFLSQIVNTKELVMKKLLILLLTIIMAASAMANVSWWGDARVRPRLDIKNYGDYPHNNIVKSSDFYYLYRARLNLKATIGDGFFFQTQLAHNGAAWWAGKFGTGIDYGSSPSTNYTLLYFGRQTDHCGFKAGLIPVNGAKNPALDMHFHPGELDLPFTIQDLNSATGFSYWRNMGTSKVSATVLVNDNAGHKYEYAEGNDPGELEIKDQYTFMLDYSANLGFAMVQPVFMMTTADDTDENTAGAGGSAPAPITYGVNITGPSLAGLKPTLNFHMTSNSADNSPEYNGYMLRVKLTGKLGFGSLNAWYAMSKMTWGPDNAEVEENFSYIWLAYKMTFHKSDMGELSWMPTLRMQTDKIDNSWDFSRTRAEITFEMKFK